MWIQLGTNGLVGWIAPIGAVRGLQPYVGLRHLPRVGGSAAMPPFLSRPVKRRPLKRSTSRAPPPVRLAALCRSPVAGARSVRFSGECLTIDHDRGPGHGLDTSRWKTYIYEQAAISVPANWKVVTDYVCPAPYGPGTLFLGPSREPGVVCQNYALALNSVTLTPVPEGISDPEVTTCSPSSVHGLTVYVGPCGSSNAAGLTWWMIPELGIEAQASESGGSWVGHGSSTVVGRVLHTLRRATSQEVIDSSPVTWPTNTYGKAAISVPVGGLYGAARTALNTSAAGTLELGLPQVYSTCTALVAPTAGVTVSTPTPDTTYLSCPRLQVNGLRGGRRRL